MLSQIEITQRDKRRSASHEAGHAIAAGALGVGFIRAWIEPTGAPDFIHSKAWVGSMNYCNTGLTSQQVAVIAVAGMVAEEMFDGPESGAEGEVNADEIIEFWELDSITPSDTDLKGIPGGWKARRKAVCEALRLLQVNKAQWLKLTADLVEHESITDHEMRNYPVTA